MVSQFQSFGFHTANMPVSPSMWTETGTAFITIAQQPGAESASLPERLTKALNESRKPNTLPWSHWDRELVDKIANDFHIPPGLIESMETSGHSWIDDLLAGVAGRPDDVAIFFRLKNLARELASAGHVILIGHGSTYTTRDLPHGLHVRLIAPMQTRTAAIAKQMDLSEHQAARRLHLIDKQRQAFFKRFWPDKPLSVEIFAAELNTAALDEERLVRAILSILPQES